MSKINSALFVTEVRINDPETKATVVLAVYKHEQSGGMFAIDSSFIEQNFEDDETPMISDPFNNDSFVELDKLEEEA
jgi:hypothetical protein